MSDEGSQRGSLSVLITHHSSFVTDKNLFFKETGVSSLVFVPVSIVLQVRLWGMVFPLSLIGLKQEALQFRLVAHQARGTPGVVAYPRLPAAVVPLAPGDPELRLW